MYSIQEGEVDERGSLPNTAPLSQIIRPEEPAEADFSFARDPGPADFGAVNDLRTLVEQVMAEQLTRLERRVRSLETGSPRGLLLDSPSRASQAVQLRDYEMRLAKMSKDLNAASESHRLQILKVTQAVGELGRELTSRVERIESEDFFQNKSCDADHRKLIEEEYRSCTSELFSIVKQHGASLGKQEIALSSLREDLKTEQRIRKDEIHPKLRELAARPVRPEEQSISDLRQSVMSVRDECSKLRAECRKLSSEVMARDSEGLSKVLRQLSDMRNLLDNGTMEETVQLPVSLGKFNMLSKRPGESKSGRTSPVRDRALQVRSMSAKKPGRGATPGSKLDPTKAHVSHGDEAKVKAEDPKTSRKRCDDVSHVANMGTTPLTVDGSQKSRSKSLEGLRSQEAVNPVNPSDASNEPLIMRPNLDARLQAAVAAVVPQPKAVALAPQGITEIASARAGSPGPLLYARPGCVVTRPASPPIGRHPSQTQLTNTAPPRISALPGSCQVVPMGYQRPAPRPALPVGPVNL